MDGGLGGLGGIGGGDWNQTLMGLAIMGDSMTPRTASNPHDLTKTLAPLMAMNQKDSEKRALVSAMVAAGVPLSQALLAAENKDAASIMMQLRQERVGQAAHDKTMRDAAPWLGLPGASPDAPPGPAVPSMGGQKRSDINVPEAETPFHNLVMNAEGTAKGRGFNETLGYGKFTGGPVDLTGMKVSDVLGLQQQMLRHPENSYNSSAAGGYQVVGKTLRSLVNQGVVSPEDTYDAKTQNKIASYLAMQRGPDVAGLRNEWEGLRNVPADKILSAWQQSFGQGGPKQVASADPGFVPPSSLMDSATGQPMPADHPSLTPLRNQAPPPAATPPDWRTAQATPEQFDQQLARARGGVPAPPQAQQPPQVATQAPAAPPAPPPPIQRPTAPQQPTSPPGAAMGMSSIDPNSGDGGAKTFAASGMGRGGPFLTPPPPMALPGAPASPAPVTAPVTPSATPAPAPAAPPSTGGTQVAQAPTQTATDAAQTQVVERQAQTIVQSASPRGPENFTGRTQQAIAADYYKRGMMLGLLATTPNLPPAAVKDFEAKSKFFLDRAAKYLDPSDQENLINKAVEGLPKEQQAAVRQQLYMAAANKAPPTIQEAEYAHGPGTPAARGAVQEKLSTDPSPTIMAKRELAARGLQPGMAQYDKEFPATQEKYAKATASTTVNEAPKIETAYDQKMGTQFAEMNQKLIEGAGNANRKIATIQRLQSLLADPSVYSGAGGEKVLQAKRLAKSIGIDVEGLEGSEAILSITNQFALELRNPSSGAGMPGAMSDSDRDFLKTIPPGLNRSKEGNALVADFMLRQEKRAIEINDLRRDYVKANKRLDEGFYEKLDAWSAKNPLFTADDQKKVERAISSGPAGPAEGGGGRVVDSLENVPEGALVETDKGHRYRKVNGRLVPERSKAQ